MSFPWNGYDFDGGYDDPNRLQAKAGIYLVFTKEMVIDIGESEDVRNRILTHDRKDCWQRKANGGVLYYAAHNMPGSSIEARHEIELRLRSLVNLPCGEK